MNDAFRHSDSDLLRRVDELNRIGVALSQEKDITRLLETILLAAKEITNADGGTLYRMTEEKTLRFEIMRNDTLNIAMGGTSGVEIPFYPIYLHDKDGKPILSMVASYAVHHDRSVNIADAYTQEGFDFSGTKSFDKKTGYRSQSFLTVPMKNHESEIIGVLQLINAKDPATGAVVPFNDTDQHLAESLASQAAIALTNRLLINHLEDLFESFINLINAAIDDKSPYTGGHCQRVPVLTMLLAEAVNNCTVGPLRDFTMTDRDRYELKIAGLLHDCGKVTTPVHVVDKATKLQTINDRIGMIDTRFEVVKRDAEIALLKEQLAAARGQAGGAAAPAPESRWREIDEDRDFLRRANFGGEGMKEEDVARVKAISEKYCWSDTTGRPAAFLSQEELDNLTIRYGTLTAAERSIINHHIEVTIQMLESLPWPKHLKNVPEYAGGHHERMDGKGYPRGLKREQMSVQARCMGIADIFEALTAKDRPYKKGKTLTEALTILGKFKLNGHVDPDLFDIFMWGKVYDTYAKQFLDPDQIDEVDVTQIPGYVHAAPVARREARVVLLKLLRGAFARRRGPQQPRQTGGEPPQAVVDRSRALQRSREFDAAGAMIEGLIERDGGGLNARSRADLLIEAGLCRLRQFRLDEASRHFEAARRASPGHPLVERIGQFPQLMSSSIELRRGPLPPVGPARARQDGLTAVYFYLDVPGVPARDRQAYAELLRRSVRSLKAAVPGARAALITDRATEVAGTIGFDEVFREDLDAGELVYGRLAALSRLPGSQGMDGNLVLLDPDTQVLRDFSAIFSLEFDLGFTLRSDFVEAAMDHEPINAGVIFVRAAGAARARGFFRRCVERFPDVENRPAIRRFYPDGLRAWRGDQVLPAAVVGWREFVEYVLSGRTDRLQVEDCAIAFFESSLYNCSETSATADGGGRPYILHYKGQRKVQVLEKSAAERS